MHLLLLVATILTFIMTACVCVCELYALRVYMCECFTNVVLCMRVCLCVRVSGINERRIQMQMRHVLLKIQ